MKMTHLPAQSVALAKRGLLAAAVRSIRTVRDFDAMITAPYNGYNSLEAYYAAVSAPHQRNLSTRLFELSY